MSTQDTANLVTSINLWNTELPKRLDAFSQLNDLANITLIDMQEPFSDALANPSKYGATDATCQACEGVSPIQTCADPNPKCLWYNSYHPGQPIQKMIADVVAENLSPMWFQSYGG
jgi:phospholipase/lecithinase/hemolysin